MEIDELGSAEFDLTEAIKNLIYSIKTIKNDVVLIKEHLNLDEGAEIKLPIHANHPRKFL